MIESLPSDYLKNSASSKVSTESYLGHLYDLIIPFLYMRNNGPLNVLELGVSEFGIGSGHAFSEMPYVDVFVGVDVVPIVSNFSEKGIFIHADCHSEKCFIQLYPYTPFNLIIHDAVHSASSQIFFFQQYFSLLDTPGVMFCEDIVNGNEQHILKKLNDPSIHLFEVPPVGGVYSKCLVKFKY